jgi:hypothetical protein
MQHEPYILGETDRQVQFDGRLENRQIAAELIKQAHQQICIFTPDLEKHIYDDADLIRSLGQLAIRSRQTQIRVLVRDAEQAVKSGHRLIELYRRHTSSIHIHQIPEDTDNIQAAYLIVDNAGYLYKHMGNLFNGYFNANDKLKVRELSKHFDGAWERSRPDPDMRRLFI